MHPDTSSQLRLEGREDSWKQIKSLDTPGCTHTSANLRYFSDYQIPRVARALQNNDSVVEFTLRYDINQGRSLPLVVQALTPHTTLQSLFLSLDQIQDSELAALGHFLRSNSSLTSLSLAITTQTLLPYPEAGLRSLAEAVACNAALCHLSLENIQISAPVFQTLARCLKSREHPLPSLCLQRSRLPSEFGEELAQVPGLRSLNLTQAKFSNSGRVAARILETNSDLRVLELGVNELGHPGAALISRALAANRSLSRLYLDFNQIGDPGAIDLAAALRGHPTLKHISLKNNNIRDVGIRALAEAVRDPESRLKYLDLCEWWNNKSKISRLFPTIRNHIGSSGLQALAQTLEVNTSLRVLGLPFVLEGPALEGLEALDAAMDSNSTLRRIGGCLLVQGEEHLRPRFFDLAEQPGYQIYKSVQAKVARNFSNHQQKRSQLFPLLLEKIPVSPGEPDS